jgi:chromosome segregation ATPase
MILESKNAKYKEQLHRAKQKLNKNNRASSKGLSRNESIKSVNEDSFSQNTSFQSNHMKQSAQRRAPRKSLMLFMDVRNKLNLICDQNERMSKNMDDMVGEIKRTESRRASMFSNRGIDFNEIKEEDEEEVLVKQPIKIKDELTEYKERLNEYNQIMKEMTEQFDRIEGENQILEAELEKYENFYFLEQEKLEMVNKEKEMLNQKYLNLLEMYENKEMELEEVEQNVKEMQKQEKQIKVEAGKNEIVMMNDNEQLFKENKNLVSELDFLKKKLLKVITNQTSVEEMNKEAEVSHRDLLEKLKYEVEQKEFLERKINVITEEIQTNKKLMEQQQDEVVEQMNHQITSLKNENRELQGENRELEEKVRQLELKSMSVPENIQRQSNAEDGLLEFGTNLENNELILDINEHGMGGIDYADMEDLEDIPDYFSKKDEQFGTSADVFNQFEGEGGLDAQSQGRGSVNELNSKLFLSKSIDDDIFDELNEKNQEIQHLKNEKENILRQKKEEMDGLRAKIIQLQKDCQFELDGMKRKMKHECKIFKKEKRKYEKEINGLQARVVQLKVKTSNTMVEKDEIEMRFVKKMKLLQNKIIEYESMIREHNLMAKKKKNQGFFRSILNF